MADNPFTMPRTMRDLAEQSIKQAHAAYDQLADVLTKAMGSWMGVLPANGLTDGFKGVQQRAAQIAKENTGSAFALADKLAQAQNFQEVWTLQTQFAQDRTKAFVAQTQELVKLAGEALRKPARN